MNLGIIIYSTDSESVWNAFRLGVFSLKQGDKVKAFLLAKGVESEKLSDEKFNVLQQMQLFASEGGEILACGTCLKIRDQEGSELCPISTMKDLYEIIKNSDKVVSI
jgi:uncharacterized protein involved in oxidation of intracellular sulfur